MAEWYEGVIYRTQQQFLGGVWNTAKLFWQVLFHFFERDISWALFSVSSVYTFGNLLFLIHIFIKIILTKNTFLTLKKLWFSLIFFVKTYYILKLCLKINFISLFRPTFLLISFWDRRNIINSLVREGFAFYLSYINVSYNYFCYTDLFKKQNHVWHIFKSSDMSLGNETGLKGRNKTNILHISSI